MRMLVYAIISSWVMAGLLMYCHRHDLQTLRQAYQDKQGVSLLEELK